MSSENDIRYNPNTYVPRKSIEDLWEEFLLPARKFDKRKLFLLLGEAGFGKTWLSSYLATYCLEKLQYPVFHLTFREGLDQFFGLTFNNFTMENVMSDVITAVKTANNPLIFIVDGYDEQPSRETRQQLVTLLQMIEQNNAPIYVLITSRYHDWYQCNLVRRKFKQTYSSFIWHPPKITIKEETAGTAELLYYDSDEIINALQRYNLPLLEEWPLNIKFLSKYPLWIRIIGEIFLERKTLPRLITNELVDRFFDRMGLEGPEIRILGILAGKMLDHLTNPHLRLSSITNEVPDVDLQFLTSVGTIFISRDRYNPQMRFANEAFFLFGLSYHLKELSESKSLNDNGINLLLNTSGLSKEKIENVVCLLESLLQRSLIRDETITEEKIQTPESFDEGTLITDSLVDKTVVISENYQTRLIEAIENSITIYQKFNIPLLRLVQQTELPIEDIQGILARMITQGEISGKIEDKGTIDPSDDILILEEKWNMFRKEKPREEVSISKEEKFDLKVEYGREELVERIDSLDEKYREKLGVLPKTKKVYDDLYKINKELRSLINIFIESLYDEEKRKWQIRYDEEIQRLVEADEERWFSYSQKRAKFQREINILEISVRNSKREHAECLEKINQYKETGEEIKLKESLKNKDLHLNQIKAYYEQIRNAKQSKESLIKEFVLEAWETLTTFRGVTISELEYANLNYLELKVGLLPHLIEVDENATKGFSVSDNHVIGIALHRQLSRHLPINLSIFRNLEILNMSHNSLTEVPPNIGTLQNLKILNLEENKITTSSETNLPFRLQVLNLSSNEISVLPESICYNSDLQVLLLSNNKLDTLPMGFPPTKLEELDLSNNQFTCIPSSIEHSASDRFRVLKLNNNQITKLPKGITSLTKLKTLWLFDNPLETTLSQPIFKWLKKLKTSGCDLRLPFEIEDISIQEPKEERSDIEMLEDLKDMLKKELGNEGK
jgi:hypothetical protein